MFAARGARKVFLLDLRLRSIRYFESMINTTYSQARQNLASLLDQVTRDREIAIIKRRGNEDVALVSADELSGLLETAHLLRSPANAERLLTALNRARSKKPKAKSLVVLRKELGLGKTR